MICSELVGSYINDIEGHIFAGDEDVMINMRNGPSSGLHLNITKCELTSLIMPVQFQSLNDFIVVSPSDANLLGAPLFPGALRGTALNMK